MARAVIFVIAGLFIGVGIPAVAPIAGSELRLAGSGGDGPTPTATQNAWIDAFPVPSARASFAMTYDSRSDRVVLYGGWAGATGRNGDTWAYDFEGNAWSNARPSASPPALTEHAMVYHPGLDRTLLFGGFEAAGQSSKTWAYDAAANRWTNPLPSPSAPIRVSHAMVYDEQSDRVVMFGGSPYSNRTWVYNGTTNSWWGLPALSGPYQRMDHVMAYDAQSDRIVLFGGQYGVPLNDTWTYDLETDTWLEMRPPVSPPGLLWSAVAYDAQSDRVVLFGGWDGTRDTSETWAYDLEANLWTKMAPTVSPSPRNAQELAYDDQSDRMILFGGNPLNRETWAYDLDADVWTRLGPPTWPPARDSHGIAHDIQSDRAVMFGGVLGSGASAQDTWLYDPVQNMWTEVSPAVSPSPRSGHAMAYDALADRTVLFGGVVGLNLANDTWTYDVESNAWTNTTPVVAPSPRNGAGLAYDAQSERIVLFGGGIPGGFSNETWTYDSRNGTWTRMSPPTAPSARFFFGFAYDAQSDRIVLHGGMTLAGRSAETWAYDLDSDTWIQKSPSAPPALRERAAMAYDAEADRVVLFGGYAIRYYETWGYDLEADAWANLNPPFAPMVDARHAMTYDPNGDRIILFGGVGPPGRLDGTWLYVLTSGRPAPPRMLDARLAGPNLTDVALEWERSADDGGGENDVASYDVWHATTYSAAGVGYSLLASVPAGTSTYVHAGGGVGDFATHFYEVRAVEAGTGRFTPAIQQAAKYSRAVSAGWHLLTRPLQLVDASVPSVLQTVSHDVVRAYRAADPGDPWKAYSPARAGDLGALGFAEAFWVNVTVAGQYAVAGLVVDRPSVSLLPGWNLLTYVSFLPRTAEASLSGLNVTRIEGFDPTSEPYRLRVLSPTETLVPGEAYWVHVSGPGGVWIQD